MESTEVAVGQRQFKAVWFVSDRRTYCVIAEERRGKLYLGEVCRTSEDGHDPEVALRESARKACAQVKGIKAWLFHEIRLYLHEKFTADGWRVTLPITTTTRFPVDASWKVVNVEGVSSEAVTIYDVDDIRILR